MERAGYVAALRRDGARLAEAAEGHLELPVRSCPGWSMADLVGHTGGVHGFFRQIAIGVTTPDRYRELDRPADLELIAWFRQGVEGLAADLEVLDPAAPAWTWAVPQEVGWIQRRMAQETAVHAWDAMDAAGGGGPIETTLAVDGIDEFLEHFLPSEPEHLAGPAQTVHLHATDAEAEWVVRVGDGACDVDRRHGQGDVTVRGPASDLLLLLWRRRQADGVEVHGDATALDAFLARTCSNSGPLLGEAGSFVRSDGCESA